MGMKVGIVGATCHADGDEKGGLKLLGDGSGEAMQMFWSSSCVGPPCCLKDSDVKGARREGALAQPRSRRVQSDLTPFPCAITKKKVFFFLNIYLRSLGASSAQLKDLIKRGNLKRTRF